MYHTLRCDIENDVYGGKKGCRLLKWSPVEFAVSTTQVRCLRLYCGIDVSNWAFMMLRRGTARAPVYVKLEVVADNKVVGCQ